MIVFYVNFQNLQLCLRPFGYQVPLRQLSTTTGSPQVFSLLYGLGAALKVTSI